MSCMAGYVISFAADVVLFSLLALAYLAFAVFCGGALLWFGVRYLLKKKDTGYLRSTAVFFDASLKALAIFAAGVVAVMALSAAASYGQMVIVGLPSLAGVIGAIVWLRAVGLDLDVTLGKALLVSLPVLLSGAHLPVGLAIAARLLDILAAV